MICSDGFPCSLILHEMILSECFSKFSTESVKFLFIRSANPFAFGLSSVFPASYVHDPPDSSLSPSPLLFVSHSPTTCHFMLPNSSTSLFVSSSVLNVRVL